MTKFYDVETSLEIMKAIQEVTETKENIAAVKKMSERELIRCCGGMSIRSRALCALHNALTRREKALFTLQENAKEIEL